MKKLFVVLAALFSMAGLSACNTVAGMGKDVKAAGSGMENASDQVKEKM